MHPTSMESMRKFKEAYLTPQMRVLDVGSLNICGSYKELFPEEHFRYIGLDIVPGLNVDIIAEKPYEWPLEDESFDAVISGQTFEHIEFPELTMVEVRRVLKPDGYCCIVAPSFGPPHCGNDYRRYDRESMKLLAEWGGLKVISIECSPVDPWYDVILIAQKKEPSEVESGKRTKKD